MNSDNLFMNAALRKISYTDYCRAHDLHPCPYTIPGTSAKAIVDFSRNIFLKPYSAYILAALTLAARTQFALRRAVVGYLHRRMPAHTATDLMLEPLAQVPAAHLMNIYADRKKYTFRITDLLTLLHSALTHSNELVSAPLSAKNPYTGVTFRPETIYLIFVRVHESTFFVPQLFHNYVKAGLSLRRFTLANECTLRDLILKSMVKNLSPKMVHREVRFMFDDIQRFDHSTSLYFPIIAHADLLPTRALDQFKQWLYAYYTHLYSFNPYGRQAAYKILVKAMQGFIAENPKFGTVVKGVICADVVCAVRPVQLN